MTRNRRQPDDAGDRPEGGAVSEISVTLLVSLKFCDSYSPVDDPAQQDVCFWLDCHQGEFDVTTDPASPNEPRIVKPGKPILIKGRYRKITIHGNGHPKDGDGNEINNAGHITPCG
jgi:hypothetical protein